MASKITAAALCLVLAMTTGCVPPVDHGEDYHSIAAAWLAAGTLEAPQLGGWDLPANEDDEPVMPSGEDNDALGDDSSGDESRDNSGSGGALIAPELPLVEVRNEITGSGRGDRRGLGLRRLLGR